MFPGIYNVKVSNRVTGCNRDRNIKVSFSEKPEITAVDVIDFNEVNSIRVDVKGKGIYEYSIDEPYNFFQSNSFFENVPAGIYEIYVNDKKGCGLTSKKVSVIGAPKFFTPNNDGFNDFWTIKGISSEFNATSKIQIYDRYGRLLLHVNPLSQGWDGTVNGFSLPSDDYWYTLVLQDGREAKGHFTLKR